MTNGDIGALIGAQFPYPKHCCAHESGDGSSETLPVDEDVVSGAPDVCCLVRSRVANEVDVDVSATLVYTTRCGKWSTRCLLPCSFSRCE
jgi:hypothetical protein